MNKILFVRFFFNLSLPQSERWCSAGPQHDQCIAAEPRRALHKVCTFTFTKAVAEVSRCANNTAMAKMFKRRF